MLPRSSIFRLRKRSLLRAIVLSLSAFAVSLRLAGFPYIQNLHGSRWQLATLVVACWGLGETIRCLGQRWNLYHAGILLLIYTNLMILTMIGFLIVYP